jgi:hypothetical protein
VGDYAIPERSIENFRAEVRVCNLMVMIVESIWMEVAEILCYCVERVVARLRSWVAIENDVHRLFGELTS